MSTVLTDDDAKRFLAEHLRRLLDEKGVTQFAFASAIAVSPMAVTYWLKGERMAGAGPLSRMAEYFGVTVDFLLTRPAKRKSKKSA